MSRNSVARQGNDIGQACRGASLKGTVMIVVRLMGGLGNQMFQYAAGRRLAHVSGVPLKLDLSWFRSAARATPRSYGLHPFAIAEAFASDAELARIAAPAKRLAGLIARFTPLYLPYLKEKHFHFDPGLLKPRRNAYLDGYWQSEKYFSDIRDIIASELTVREPAQGMNRELAELMADPELTSVSLHVRRGDYVSSPKVSSLHGSCSPQYYAKAMELIACRVPRPHFYVFSDDPQWAGDNLPTSHPCTFVRHNGPEHAHEDMRLMTLCRHHIIANSTFSWWGAWLCRNADKIVIAPRQWFAQAGFDASDVAPESWTRA